MSEIKGLKTKLGVNVFKHDPKPHIKIKAGMEYDRRLQVAVLVCPAGLYSIGAGGSVEFSIDGCLECGTCRLACGTEVLDWAYPPGGSGVQYRFG
jgi:ferredoxin like protein